MTPPIPLEALPLVRALREWPWLLPAVETAHIVGFVVMVGSVAMFDLRVLGLSRQVPATALARHLLPWSAAALLLVVPTGLVLFLAHATELLASRTFPLKMGLLMLAGLNAVAFHTGPWQSVKAWDVGGRAPLAARASVAASLAIWVAIIACGRFLAYAGGRA